MMNWDDYFMQIAEVTKLQSGCTRRQVGAVFVTKDRRIVATGYNHAPSGLPHCEQAGCTLINDHCVRAIHAEQNGILNASRVGQSLQNTFVYVTSKPCLRCLMALRNAGVSCIFYKEDYPIDPKEKALYEELAYFFSWIKV